MECSICIRKYTTYSRMRSKIVCSALQVPKIVGAKKRGCDESACAQCVDRYVSQDILAPKCMFCHERFELSALLESVSVWRFKKLVKLEMNTRLQAELVLLEETRRIVEQQRQPFILTTTAMESVLPSLLNTSSFPDSSDLKDLKDLCNKCLQPFPLMFRTKCLEHECDKEIMSCVSYLKTRCKPCPKCNVVIEKEEGGCDQMFCVLCKALFSWQTGRLLTENEPRHNPHYYEWRRQQPNSCERSLLDNPREGPFLVACNEKLQNENFVLNKELQRVFFWFGSNPPQKGTFLLRFQEILVTQQTMSLRLLEEDAGLRYALREKVCVGQMSFGVWKSRFRAYCNTIKRDTDLRNVIFEVLDSLYSIVLDQAGDSEALSVLFSSSLESMYKIANRYGRTVVYSVRV